MSRAPVDIPLDRDGSGRLLRWLIALMVYLAALALAGAFALDRALSGWSQGLRGRLTVELPAPEAGQGDGGLAAALAVLKATPGVLAAAPLDRAATAKLIEPWLGRSLPIEELPLPTIIDIHVDARSGLDAPALKAKLVAAAPRAVLDDHQLWLGRLAGLVGSAEATAVAIVALVGAAAILTVVFTTRSGLSVHRDAIELLHLMGSRDRAIARRFQAQALRFGFVGGSIGLVVAALTLLALGRAADATVLLGDRAALLPNLHLAARDWAVLMLLPMAAAAIATITARLTVLRALAHMP